MKPPPFIIATTLLESVDCVEKICAVWAAPYQRFRCSVEASGFRKGFGTADSYGTNAMMDLRGKSLTGRGRLKNRVSALGLRTCETLIGEM